MTRGWQSLTWNILIKWNELTLEWNENKLKHHQEQNIKRKQNLCTMKLNNFFSTILTLLVFTN